jgi:hypothetical protein
MFLLVRIALDFPVIFDGKLSRHVYISDCPVAHGSHSSMNSVWTCGEKTEECGTRSSDVDLVQRRLNDVRENFTAQ